MTSEKWHENVFGQSWGALLMYRFSTRVPMNAPLREGGAPEGRGRTRPSEAATLGRRSTSTPCVARNAVLFLFRLFGDAPWVACLFGASAPLRLCGNQTPRTSRTPREIYAVPEPLRPLRVFLRTGTSVCRSADGSSAFRGTVEWDGWRSFTGTPVQSVREGIRPLSKIGRTARLSLSLLLRHDPTATLVRNPYPSQRRLPGAPREPCSSDDLPTSIWRCRKLGLIHGQSRSKCRAAATSENKPAAWHRRKPRRLKSAA